VSCGQVRLHTYVPHMTVGRLPAHQLAAALDATSVRVLGDQQLHPLVDISLGADDQAVRIDGLRSARDRSADSSLSAGRS
jgi:hypothetical protein